MRLQISVRTLDRVWTGLLAVAIVLLARDAARGAQGAVVATDPAGIYRMAWREVAATFVDPTFNGQDWTTWEHKFDGKLNTVEEARDAIKSMTASLDDRYTRVATIVQADAAPSGSLEASAGAGSTIQAPSSAAINVMPAAPVESPMQLFVTAKQIGDVGYIKISSFGSKSMVAEFKTSLASINASRMILDLRGNRGGSVSNALEIADMLLPDGKIMTAVSRSGRKTYTASGTYNSDSQIAVLVDGKTASAAEILTGALHDNHRAVVVGTKTFGKGLIQEVTTLPGNLQLFVTSARYYTPSGTDINKKGIEPDVEVSADADAIKVASDQLH